MCSLLHMVEHVTWMAKGIIHALLQSNKKSSYIRYMEITPG